MDWPILFPRIGVSLVMITFGINQIVSPHDWEKEYVPGWLRKIMPMWLHGLGNVVLGLWLISGLLFNWSLWVVFLWWLAILPFAFYGSWKAGMRDLAIVSSMPACYYLMRSNTP